MVIELEQYKLESVPTKKLRLDPENPRFYHLQLKGRHELTQDDLNKEIWDEDATITLSKAVAHEGIRNPIVVWPIDDYFLVIDGNRRVVTVRRLIHEEVKPPEGVSFDHISAYILPRNTPKQEIEVLKGVLQMGQKPWGPFNDAAYVRRLRVVYKMEYEDIAASIQLSVKEIKERMANYSLFEEYTQATKDMDPSRFSYFADAPRPVRDWFESSDRNLNTYFQLICPTSPTHKIRSVSTKGGLRDFAKILGDAQVLERLISDPDVTVEDALDGARAKNPMLANPFLKQVGGWATKLKGLDGSEIEQLKREPRFKLELGRLKDACTELLERLKST